MPIEFQLQEFHHPLLRLAWLHQDHQLVPAQGPLQSLSAKVQYQGEVEMLVMMVRLGGQMIVGGVVSAFQV